MFCKLVFIVISNIQTYDQGKQEAQTEDEYGDERWKSCIIVVHKLMKICANVNESTWFFVQCEMRNGRTFLAC